MPAISGEFQSMAVDTNMSSSALSASFRKNASLPQQDIQRAADFTTQLQDAIAHKTAVAPETVAQAREALQTLDNHLELYAFNGAVLAGQADTSREMDTSLKQLEKNVGTAEKAREHLSAALKGLG
jgi:hypothetical protein